MYLKWLYNILQFLLCLSDMLFDWISLVVVVFVSVLIVVVYSILNTKFWGWYFVFIYIDYFVLLKSKCSVIQILENNYLCANYPSFQLFCWGYLGLNDIPLVMSVTLDLMVMYLGINELVISVLVSLVLVFSIYVQKCLLLDYVCKLTL